MSGPVPELQTWQAKLEEQGWSVQPEAVQELLEGGQGASSPAALQRALLDADLRQVGKPVLPEDVNRADSRKLAGPHVLQVVSAADIAQPSKLADADRKGRILRIKMTDGKTSCTGIEYHALPAVKAEQLVPGTKVRLRGCALRLGVLLLEPRCLEVLGGRVGSLAEGWEMLQRFGGTAERADEQAVERAPPFRHFDPSDPGVLAAAARPTARTAVLPAAMAAAAAAAGARGPKGGRGQREDGGCGGFGGGRGGRGGGEAAPGPAAAGHAPLPPGATAAAVTAAQAPQPPPGMAAPLLPPPQQPQQQQLQGRARRGFQPYQPPSARAAATATEPAAAAAAAAAPPPPPAQPGERRLRPPAVAPAATPGPAQQQPLPQQRQQPGADVAARQPPEQATAPAASAAHAGAPAGEAARQRLMEKLAASDAQGGRFGRGRGGPRRGRRSRYDDDADDGSITLEEWEVQQRAGKGAGSRGPDGGVLGGPRQGGGMSQAERDEELARQLQRQLDMEDAFGAFPPGQQVQRGTSTAELAASLFRFDRDQPAEGPRGRGRGRGRAGRR